MDKKTLRNDIILIVSLLLVAIASFVIVTLTTTKSNLTATVSVQNKVVEVIDLSIKEERDYEIQGLNGVVHIHTKEGMIAVTESNCPHQDCVHMGYIKDTSHPIICAYNAVIIVINGNSNYDAELGNG